MDRKAEIMQKVRHKLEEKEDVDLENLLSILSPEDRKSIKLQLCLPLLRQVIKPFSPNLFMSLFYQCCYY